MLVHVIADYGAGDLAFAEPVPAFATLAAGFCIEQLGLNEAPPGTLIYHNVAPRQDDDSARADNAGERLAYARLPTGVRVIGVNAGHAISFVRDVAEELRWAAVPAEGSQFRSRDLFPQAAAAIALGRPDALGDDMSREDVPEVPADRVAYVDGYGNIKTTIPRGQGIAEPGTRVRVRVGEQEIDAVASDGTFAVEPGTIAFAPGSSGWPLPDKRDVRWMELFLRGGNAWERLARPGIGAAVAVDGPP